ncbi:hypothetical protein LCGC14_2535290 [marine sediment metagenome]|uniref:NAD-dependent epimerase/dehydratase domain-containing protein n=1 Tax=marine sediment metagenome TaxID=412755 RepID=A0A0F9DKE5_9ZZZZ
MLILLTGSTGFIGSRLEEELTSRGHDVHQLVRYLAGGRYSFHDNERVHFADMRDSDSVRAVVLEVMPRVIISRQRAFFWKNALDTHISSTSPSSQWRCPRCPRCPSHD